MLTSIQQFFLRGSHPTIPPTQPDDDPNGWQIAGHPFIWLLYQCITIVVTLCTMPLISQIYGQYCLLFIAARSRLHSSGIIGMFNSVQEDLAATRSLLYSLATGTGLTMDIPQADDVSVVATPRPEP